MPENLREGTEEVPENLRVGGGGKEGTEEVPENLREGTEEVPEVLRAGG